jgi:DNA-binding response OmpR family regulator
VTAPVHDDSARPKTVLLVEDDAAVRDSFMKALRDHGFEILEAASGDEALSLCVHGKETIEIAIIDMSMPQMWGDELAQRLAIVSPKTKIIFISGHSEDFLRSTSALTGTEIFFAKPFLPTLLLQKIKELLGIEVPAPAAHDGPSAAAEDENSPPQSPHFTEYLDLHMETDRNVE